MSGRVAMNGYFAAENWMPAAESGSELAAPSSTCRTSSGSQERRVTGRKRPAPADSAVSSETMDSLEQQLPPEERLPDEAIPNYPGKYSFRGSKRQALDTTQAGSEPADSLDKWLYIAGRSAGKDVSCQPGRHASKGGRQRKMRYLSDLAKELPCVEIGEKDKPGEAAVEQRPAAGAAAAALGVQDASKGGQVAEGNAVEQRSERAGHAPVAAKEHSPAAAAEDGCANAPVEEGTAAGCQVGEEGASGDVGKAGYRSAWGQDAAMREATQHNARGEAPAVALARGCTNPLAKVRAAGSELRELDRHVAESRRQSAEPSHGSMQQPGETEKSALTDSGLVYNRWLPGIHDDDNVSLDNVPLVFRVAAMQLSPQDIPADMAAVMQLPPGHAPPLMGAGPAARKVLQPGHESPLPGSPVGVSEALQEYTSRRGRDEGDERAAAGGWDESVDALAQREATAAAQHVPPCADRCTSDNQREFAESGEIPSIGTQAGNHDWQPVQHKAGQADLARIQGKTAVTMKKEAEGPPAGNGGGAVTPEKEMAGADKAICGNEDSAITAFVQRIGDEVAAKDVRSAAGLHGAEGVEVDRSNEAVHAQKASPWCKKAPTVHKPGEGDPASSQQELQRPAAPVNGASGESKGKSSAQHSGVSAAVQGNGDFAAARKLLAAAGLLTRVGVGRAAVDYSCAPSAEVQAAKAPPYVMTADAPNRHAEELPAGERHVPLYDSRCSPETQQGSVEPTSVRSVDIQGETPKKQVTPDKEVQTAMVGKLAEAERKEAKGHPAETAAPVKIMTSGREGSSSGQDSGISAVMRQIAEEIAAAAGEEAGMEGHAAAGQLSHGGREAGRVDHSSAKRSRVQGNIRGAVPPAAAIKAAAGEKAAMELHAAAGQQSLARLKNKEKHSTAKESGVQEQAMGGVAPTSATAIAGEHSAGVKQSNMCVELGSAAHSNGKAATPRVQEPAIASVLAKPTAAVAQEKASVEVHAAASLSNDKCVEGATVDHQNALPVGSRVPELAVAPASAAKTAQENTEMCVNGNRVDASKVNEVMSGEIEEIRGVMAPVSCASTAQGQLPGGGQLSSEAWEYTRELQVNNRYLRAQLALTQHQLAAKQRELESIGELILAAVQGGRSSGAPN